MKFTAAIVLLLAFAAVASARPVGLRSIRQWDDDAGEHHWNDDDGGHIWDDDDVEEKEPTYCTGLGYSKDECPEHYECAALDRKVCKPVKDCDDDDHDECTQCWEYACVEIPKYCNVTYGGKDECVTKYGEEKDLKCKELDKHEEACVYDKECKYVDTDVCLRYVYEDKCTYVPTDVCLEHNQKTTCEKDQKVCKAYKQKKVCKPAKGKCDKYYNGECEDDCEYVDTDDCVAYKEVKGKCKSVNTTCKKYKEERQCEKVKKGCLEYEQEEVCHDVKVCWTGKCVKVEAPKKAPKKTPKKADFTYGK